MGNRWGILNGLRKEYLVIAFQNIDECLYRILKDSLVYLNSRKIAVDPMTQKTYDYYKKEMGKED